MMDVGRGTVSFAALGVKDLPLVKTSRGHLAVDLLDFDRTSLSDNEFSQPSARGPRGGTDPGDNADRPGHGRFGGRSALIP